MLSNSYPNKEWFLQNLNDSFCLFSSEYKNAASFWKFKIDIRYNGLSRIFLPSLSSPRYWQRKMLDPKSLLCSKILLKIWGFLFSSSQSFGLKYRTFHVLTTLFQSTSFTYFTCNYRSSAVNRSFPVLLLLKKCSLDKKSYVFSKFCSHIERFRSENSFLQGLT